MSGPSWFDIDALRSLAPGFEASAQYIRSTVDPLRDGPGGMEGGTYIYGDDDNGKKFSLSIAEGAREIEKYIDAWAGEASYASDGISAEADFSWNTEDNNVKLAKFKAREDPDESPPGGGGLTPLEPFVSRPVTEGTPSVPPGGGGTAPLERFVVRPITEGITPSVSPVDET